MTRRIARRTARQLLVAKKKRIASAKRIDASAKKIDASAIRTNAKPTASSESSPDVVLVTYLTVFNANAPITPDLFLKSKSLF
jgi:hypothetical protein